jgi:hypothetical protein
MASEDLLAAGHGISRWWRVFGGVSMNLALGTPYAWSVFVAPPEKQFNADTFMVFTIAVVMIAVGFTVAGSIQDKTGPAYCSLAGSVLASLGFFLCSYTPRPRICGSASG